ncbi:MAG: PEP-CTERM sorting domain-containing protein [Planctomycetota bacterium]|nr:PEP-CTERM sorting domain-containing protein [Planctomycetota bacterium]
MKYFARFLLRASTGAAVLLGCLGAAHAGGISINPTTIGSTGDPVYYYDFKLYLDAGSVLSYQQHAAAGVYDSLTVFKVADVQSTTIGSTIFPATGLPSAPTGPWSATAKADGSGLDIKFNYTGAILDNSKGSSNIFLGDFIVFTDVNTATATQAQKDQLAQLYKYTSDTTSVTGNPPTYHTGAVAWGVSTTQAAFAPEPSTFVLLAAASIPAAFAAWRRGRRTA